MNLPELTCTQATKNPVATNRNRCPRRSQSDLIAARQRNEDPRNQTRRCGPRRYFTAR
jgi:hypothetical protein